MYTLTLDLTIRYTINSFLFFSRTSLLIESCAYFIFKRVVQFVHSFVQSLSVFSQVFAPILLACLGYMDRSFFLDQCSECLLCLVCQYCLRSLVVFQTLWTYFLEQIITIINYFFSSGL